MSRILWEGHRERLRLQMEREGWDSLKPYEMVELVLYHAVPRQNLNDVSRALVNWFGSVGGVFAASRAQLTEVPGVTAAMAEWIFLTGELMRAYYDIQGRPDIRLSCFQEVRDFLRGQRFGGGEPARMRAIYADFDFNLITFSDFDEDLEWWDAANVRRMLTDSIANGARYVYLALWVGNAASGMEREGVARLEAIAATLRAAGLDLVDCLLTDGTDIHSMNLRGEMNAIRAESGCMELYERYTNPKP